MSESYTARASEAESSSSSILSKVYQGIFLLVLISALLWNWDGFWQTDISWLNKAQQSAFPNKFTEEQIKMSRAVVNTAIFEDISERMKKIEAENQRLYDEKQQAKRNLDVYLQLENQKCRYYDTSLRMLDIMAKKYSVDELKRVLSCTSAECEHILSDREFAESICS